MENIINTREFELYPNINVSDILHVLLRVSIVHFINQLNTTKCTDAVADSVYSRSLTFILCTL